MKQPLLILCTLLIVIASISQTPGVKWTRYIRTSNDGEAFFDIKGTPDDGYIAVGTDSLFTSDYQRFWIANKALNSLAWIVKLDTAGNVVWRRDNRVNDYNSAFTSVVLSSDGGYVSSGYNGNGSDSSQFYIVKYSASGTLLWEKFYGGTFKEYAYSIAKTSSGGYAVAGITLSNNGDVSGNHSNPGYSDVWLMKTDADGNIIWKNCYGGLYNDTAFSVIQTADKGFVVAGSSTSSDGNLTGNNGGTDAWLFKTDSLGNLVWQKNFGGTGEDGFKSVVLNSDGSFTATGYTYSASAASNGNKGAADVWVTRISSDGNTVLWSKGFGGTAGEMGLSIIRTQDDGYFVTGFTESNNNDVSGNNGLADAWAIKVTANGLLTWQKCIGTAKDEFGTGAVYQSETNLTVAGVAQPVSAVEPSDGFLARLGNSNTVKGLLYLDLNSNGIKDVGEVPFNQAIVTNSNGGVLRASTPVNGIFQFDIGTGLATTQPILQLPYYTVVPSSRNTNFATYFNKDSFSFAIRPIASRQDLNIQAIAMNPARPGFQVTYKIYYKNAGTVTIPTGQVVFIKDSRLNLQTVFPAASSVSGDTLKWDFTNLLPLSSGTITLIALVPPPPTVAIGNILSSLAIIDPIAGDITPHDDTALIRQVVQGSYDPNDKAENLGGVITKEEVTSGDYINYVIRFQNTGTDTAFNITLRDTLQSQLAAGTIQMIAASHPYQLQITSQTLMAWTFNDINLPDSNTNEVASHGFVAYRIKANNTLVAGNIINNNASIYFDYNVPEKTNIASTLVVDFITLPLRLLEFNATYQKPEAVLEWSTSDEMNVEKFEIERGIDAQHFTTVGRVVARGSNGGTPHYQFKDPLANQAGDKFFYRLKMMDIDQKFTYSGIELVKIEGKSINEVIVSPNPVRGRKGVLSINFNNDAMAELSVVDMQGRQVIIGKQKINKGYNVLPLDLSSFTAGAYLLQVKAEGKQLVTRFIITK